jgi:hypothetical protein
VKKFPHLVQMHREHAQDGLVCMSLDVSEDELTSQNKVLDFLKKQGAAFPNFILKDDEKARDEFLDKYNLNITPAVLLFDRSGKRVNVPDGASQEELERLVKDLLAAK